MRMGLSLIEKLVVMAMSLRNMIRSRWWWVLVAVMWMLALFGIYPHVPGLTVTVNIGPALDLTFLVAVVQAVEYLTRPAQLAQKKQHTTRKSVR